MADLTFSMLQLLQEVQQEGARFIFPNKESFKLLPENFNITIDETFYEVIVEKTDDILWLSFDFNSADPRDDNVTNINSGEKRPNDRTAEEVELIHQVFFLYYYSKQILYTSNAKKQSLISKVLKEKLQKDFIVKRLYKDINGFLSVLKSCSSISFTYSSNIFSRDSKKRQALIDLTGTDSPENFKIEAKYNKHLVKNFIMDLCGEKQNNELNSLIISGIDESDFAITYNADSFSKKIDLCCKKQGSGKFDPSEVKNILIKVINERN